MLFSKVLSAMELGLRAAGEAILQSDKNHYSANRTTQRLETVNCIDKGKATVRLYDIQENIVIVDLYTCHS